MRSAVVGCAADAGCRSVGVLPQSVSQRIVAKCPGWCRRRLGREGPSPRGNMAPGRRASVRVRGEPPATGRSCGVGRGSLSGGTQLRTLPILRAETKPSRTLKRTSQSCRASTWKSSLEGASRGEPPRRRLWRRGGEASIHRRRRTARAARVAGAPSRARHGPRVSCRRGGASVWASCGSKAPGHAAATRTVGCIHPGPRAANRGIVRGLLRRSMTLIAASGGATGAVCPRPRRLASTKSLGEESSCAHVLGWMVGLKKRALRAWTLELISKSPKSGRRPIRQSAPLQGKSKGNWLRPAEKLSAQFYQVRSGREQVHLQVLTSSQFAGARHSETKTAQGDEA